MNNTDFTEIMAKHTDEELVRIVTFDKDNYQLSAVTAAEEEIKKRNIDSETLEKLTSRLNRKIAEEIAEKEEIERPKSIWERLADFIFFIIGEMFWFIILPIMGLLILLFPKIKKYQRRKFKLNETAKGITN